jgi:hypothetical protein
MESTERVAEVCVEKAGSGTGEKPYRRERAHGILIQADERPSDAPRDFFRVTSRARRSVKNNASSRRARSFITHLKKNWCVGL